MSDYFERNVVIRNYAVPEQSSKSYYEEGWFDMALNELGEGNYLFIQFGHYDAVKDDPARYTKPFGTYKQYLTKYVEAARAKGANPILLTSIERRSFTKNGAFRPTHGDYPEAMRELSW